MKIRSKIKRPLLIISLLALIGGFAFVWLCSYYSNFDSPVNMQLEKIVHPILGTERNQELTTKLSANSFVELNDYKGPAWIQAFKPDFTRAETAAVTTLCKLAIGLNGKQLVMLTGVPSYATREFEVNGEDDRKEKKTISRDIVNWYCVYGLNAIPVKFTLEQDKCTKALVCDWRPSPIGAQTRAYYLRKANIHPILQLSSGAVDNLDQPNISGLYRFPPARDNGAWTHLPSQSQIEQKQTGSRLTDDSIFLKLNRYAPPNTRGSWTHLFGPAETAVAIKMSLRVRGLTRNQIISLAGVPTFKCSQIPGWKFGTRGQRIWIYLIGGSEIPVRLSFNGDICADSEVFDGKNLEQVFKWRVSELQKFAIGKPLPKILARLENPVKFVKNQDRSHDGLRNLLNMQSFTYSPQDSSTPVVLSFILGRCWDVHPSHELISR